LFEKGRVNPNGCPISATFYVSHEWTDYSQVQNLYAGGHEIASHSVSHSFGEQFSQKKWTKEIVGQREILSAYGGVRQEDIRGMRAPFLAVCRNKIFFFTFKSHKCTFMMLKLNYRWEAIKCSKCCMTATLLMILLCQFTKTNLLAGHIHLIINYSMTV